MSAPVFQFGLRAIENARIFIKNSFSIIFFVFYHYENYSDIDNFYQNFKSHIFQ